MLLGLVSISGLALLWLASGVDGRADVPALVFFALVGVGSVVLAVFRLLLPG
jgi:hypothetical protein